MIKRMTKITSLLVCAASIVSLVPATAADVKKYDTQEGTIYSAKAKGGVIYFDGEVNAKDEDQYYITADGKYNVLEGIDNGELIDDLLLNQYLLIADGDTVLDVKDKYKEVDNKERADLEDDVVSTLRKQIKGDNDGRFSDSDKQIATTTKFLAGGSGLSAYTYTLKNPVVAENKNVKTTDTVFVDYAGKYVDADYNLGSVKITTTPGGSTSVTLKNTDDTYEVKEGNTTYEYKAMIDGNKYITDIADDIYSWANLSIYKKVKGTADSTYDNVTDEVGFGSKGYNSFVSAGSNSVQVLLKFSKTPDTGDIDGIKYSKTAATYFIADEDGKKEVILGKDKAKSATEVGTTTDAADAIKITGNAQGLCSAFYSGKEGKVYAQNLKLKSKEGFNYVDLGDTDNSESDVAKISNTGGLIYVLDSGYVKAWDSEKESFEKVYKVDGAMNNMEISSKDFILLWNEDDEVYTVINNKKDAAATTATTATTGTATTATTTTAAVGWVKATDGTWSYNKADGTKATAWFQDGATWYYLNATGVMQTGWINDNGTWYYCNASGAMLANTTVDGYILGASGAWVK